MNSVSATLLRPLAERFKCSRAGDLMTASDSGYRHYPLNPILDSVNFFKLKSDGAVYCKALEMLNS